jgi:phage protein D
MPFAGPRIVYQLIDYDAGDELWAETPLGKNLFDSFDAINERLISFVFSDHERQKDRLVLAFHNPDYVLLDSPLFVRGQKYAVTWGWPARMAPTRRMVVTKVTGGNPLVVTMLDTTTLLDRNKVHRFMEDVTDSEFVREVARVHGYQGPTVHVEETTLRHDVTQPQWRTDAKQLAWLARRNGFIFYVDAGGLHWHSRNWKNEPVRTYFYRTDPGQGAILSEPQIEANLTRGVSTVRVLARDPITKESIDVSVGPDTSDLISLGGEREDAPNGDAGLRAERVTREDVRSLGYMTRAAAEAEAQARYRETAQKKYKLTMEIIGDAQLGAKNLIELYGVSATTDGLWYIKEVEHRIEGGQYTAQVRATKDTQREVKATRKAQRAARKNPNANANKAADEAAIAAYEQLKQIRQTATMRYGPDGEPQVVWYYVDDENEQVTNALTPAELRDLELRAQEAIAREATATQLPDR